MMNQCLLRIVKNIIFTGVLAGLLTGAGVARADMCGAKFFMTVA